MADIKESKEALIGIFELGGIMAVALKDGFQANKDLQAILMALVANEKVVKAYQNADKIPEELKDLDLLEVGELAKIGIQNVIDIISKLRN
jgi:hypothetical protein